MAQLQKLILLLLRLYAVILMGQMKSQTGCAVFSLLPLTDTVIRTRYELYADVMIGGKSEACAKHIKGAR
ncbi:hypothetical protein DV567_21675 [Salmonella enterica]|nr:hypothetical protein [Salmonella enterica]EAR4894916.1 hypothetical protein [Salmonella enterica]EAS3200820.1 hypothetical protein [Salmonella enterica]EBK8587298.1 hypothetical protein [Salmonella enterica]EBO7201638.1 hypothetical protein [Salmonella enterica]